MMWFRLDGGFAEHPKVIAAGGDAAWLHICAMSYVARMGTDGFVPSGLLSRLCDRRQPERLAERLVEVGLWDAAPGGWTIHDWHDYQPSAEELQVRRDAKRKAGTFGNHQRWHVERGIVDDECSHCIADAIAERSQVRSQPDRMCESQSDRKRIARDETRRDETDPSSFPTRQTDQTGARTVGRSVGPGDGSPEDGIGDLVDLAVAVAASRTAGVRNLARWRAGVRRNVVSEHGDALRARRGEHPGETPRAIVAAVLGIASTEVWKAEQSTKGYA